MKKRHILTVVSRGVAPHKSREGWRRYHKRTGFGARAFRHGLHTTSAARGVVQRETVTAPMARIERFIES